MKVLGAIVEGKSGTIAFDNDTVEGEVGDLMAELGKEDVDLNPADADADVDGEGVVSNVPDSATVDMDREHLAAFDDGGAALRSYDAELAAKYSIASPSRRTSEPAPSQTFSSSTSSSSSSSSSSSRALPQQPPSNYHLNSSHGNGAAAAAEPVNHLNAMPLHAGDSVPRSLQYSATSDRKPLNGSFNMGDMQMERMRTALGLGHGATTAPASLQSAPLTTGLEQQMQQQQYQQLQQQQQLQQLQQQQMQQQLQQQQQFQQQQFQQQQQQQQRMPFVQQGLPGATQVVDVSDSPEREQYPLSPQEVSIVGSAPTLPGVSSNGLCEEAHLEGSSGGADEVDVSI
jgi:hypothetical protein